MAAGIYIHVPFCISKCEYCDFYSLGYTAHLADKYTQKIILELNRWGGILQSPADTLYFGGGTPSLLSSGNIKAIIDKSKDIFSLKEAEITLEANPAERLDQYFKDIAAAGVNRISLGMQSAVAEELKIIGRRHTAEDVVSAVNAAKASGINNISLDIMLGLPNQTMQSLKQSLDFALELDPSHISAYILSLEQGTPLYKNRAKYSMADSDLVSQMYLFTCDYLRQNGYERYEISNFAKNGKISKHNTKYWTGENYLGLGPAAHSYWDKKRFYYDRNLNEYLNNTTEIEDGKCGGYDERVMLLLRLKSGLSLNKLWEDFKENFNTNTKQRLINKAQIYKEKGFAEFDGDVISLTDKGALLSNTIISEILSILE